jgi:nitrite reductase/ring-hydroxylating ferredoxin subunit/uncharacterized membrane protein
VCVLRIHRADLEEVRVRSRAQFKAHPIHPALIPFPFAFLTGAFVFDVCGLIGGDPSFSTTGAYLGLAGIGTGVLAAVPGLIDYIYTVPPNSSGKKRATRHAIANGIVLLLFSVAWLSRSPAWEPSLLTLALELVGAGLLAYSGYLGGTLVTRNMISVDHRYAEAGKWQEADFTAAAGQPLVVGHVDDLKPGQMKLLRINGRRIVLARTSDGYSAFDDRCTHRGGSLAGGVLVDRTVQCLWHGSQFDGTTGRVTCGPAKTPIRVYEAKETKNGQVLLASPPG